MDLAELRRLAEAATPGPWYVGDYEHGRERVTTYPDTAIVDEAGKVVVGAYNSHCCSFPIDIEADEKDTAYISAANPQTVLALIAELESLRGRVPER